MGLYLTEEEYPSFTTYSLYALGLRKDIEQKGSLHLQQHRTAKSLVAHLKSKAVHSAVKSCPLLDSTRHD